MLDDSDDRERRQSWRGDRESPRETHDGPRRAWRAPQTNSEETGRRNRRTGGQHRRWAQFAGAATLALGVVVLIWLISNFQGCTQTELFVYSVRDYDYPAVPVNALASADRSRLLALGTSSQFLTRKATADWDKCFSGMSSRNVLVVYLSAHIGMDTDGIYLMLSAINPDRDDRAGQAQTRVPLERLRAALMALPERQNKLLLLDICRFQTNWRMGVFQHPTIERLKQQFSDVPNLFVMTSCAAGERSWAVDHIGADGRAESVFVHFMVKGLEGSSDTNNDERITVLELFRYVHSRTNSWVKENRDPNGQHPVLIPESVLEEKTDHTFIVAVPARTRGVETSRATPRGIDGAYQSVWDLWHQLAENHQPGIEETSPAEWRDATETLLQAESLDLTGELSLASAKWNRAKTILDYLKTMRTPESGPRFADRSVVDWPVSDQNGVSNHNPEDAATNPGVCSPEAQLRQVFQSVRLPPDTVGLANEAVHVRELCERVICEAQGLLSLVRDEIQNADQIRRHGEDLLFVGDRSAEEELRHAREIYETVESKVRILQKALRVRNRLYASLPELAHWAVRRMSPENGEDRKRLMNLFRNAIVNNQLPDVQELETASVAVDDRSYVFIEYQLCVLFQVTRDLEQRLGRVLRTDEASIAMKTLNDVMEDATGRLNAMEKSFGDHARKLSQTAEQPQQRSWREIRDVLRCPIFTPETRSKLFQRLDSFSNTMNGRWTKNDEQKNPSEWTIEKPFVPRIDPGRWSSFWALQVLSLASSSPGNVNDLWTSWHDTWRGMQEDSAKVESEVTKVGDGIRRAFLNKREEVERLLEQARNTDSADALRRLLTRADLLTRTLDASDIRAFSGSEAPTIQLRRVHRAELLLTLAQRYTDDFWADWYQEASKACLSAVDQMGIEQLKPIVEQQSQLLDTRQTAYLQVDGDSVKFGTPSTARAKLQVSSRGDLPDGTAAVWLSGGATNLVILDNWSRQGVSVGSASRTHKITQTAELTLNRKELTESQLAKCPQTIRVKPQLFYRGHRWLDQASEINILPCPPKRIATSYGPLVSQTGTIVVNGTDRRPILFILDCSYSMDPLQGGQFNEARKELKKTLRALTSAGSLDVVRSVGLMAVGRWTRELENSGPVVNPDWRKKHPNAQEPPSVTEDFEIIEQMAALTPATLGKFEATLAGLKPWGNTPLVGALNRAYQGFRGNDGVVDGVIVAITDGEPTDDPDGNRAKNLGNAIRNAGQHAQISIVGFNVDNQVSESLIALAQNTGGQFFSAKTAKNLGDRLKEATDPRPYVVVGLTPDSEQHSQPLNTSCENLPRGRYRVTIEPFETTVDLSGGERLVFQLAGAGLELVTPLQRYTAAPVGPAQLGCTSFRIDDVSHKATFEFSLNPADGRSFIARPPEMHFEITPLAIREKKRCSMHWMPVAEQSVPTWKVEVEKWPDFSGANVQAWWKNERTRNDQRVSLAAAAKQAQVSLALDEDDELKLRLESVEYTPQNRMVTIVLVAADRGSGKPRSAEFYDQLANVRVELASDSSVPGFASQPRNDLNWRREFIEEEETLIYTFSELPPDFDANRAEIQITSWESLKHNAQHSTLPQVAKPDDEG